MDKEELIKKFFELAVVNGVQKKTGFWSSTIGKELKKQIMNSEILINFPTFMEKRWALFNQNFERPICPVCKINKTKYIRTYYQETCSIKCSTNLEKNKIQRKQTCLEKYGVSSPSKMIEIKEKVKQTCVEKYGVTSPGQNEKVKEKIKQTCIDRYGVEYAWQADKTKEKIKQTCIEKYGVEYAWQANKTKEKIKQTCIEKYGVENPQQNKEIRLKTEETRLEKFGNIGWNPNKVKETNLERYGVEYAWQANEIKEKIKQTNLEKFGVEYPLQSPEIFQKSKRYKKKEFIFSNNRKEMVMGYEPWALEILENEFEIEDIVCNPKFTITYDSTKKYHPDIFIKSKKLIVEVKSQYTYKKDLEKNIKKREACLKQGFSFQFWIFDNYKNLKILYGTDSS